MLLPTIKIHCNHVDQTARRACCQQCQNGRAWYGKERATSRAALMCLRLLLLPPAPPSSGPTQHHASRPKTSRQTTKRLPPNGAPPTATRRSLRRSGPTLPPTPPSPAQSAWVLAPSTPRTALGRPRGGRTPNWLPFWPSSKYWVRNFPPPPVSQAPLTCAHLLTDSRAEKQNHSHIECFYQEPCFAQPDKDFIASTQRGKIVESPHSYDLVDDATLVFGVHLYRDVWADALRRSLPGMFVGTGWDVWGQ